MLLFVKNRKKGQCDVMRCKESADWFEVDGLDGEKNLCQKHYEQYAMVTVETTEGSLEIATEPENTEALVQRETEEAEEILDGVKAFSLDTKEDLEFAAEILAESKGRYKKLDEKEKEITRPMNEALKAARALFKKPKSFYVDVEKILKEKIGEYHLAEAERNETAMKLAAEAHAEGNNEQTSTEIAKIGRVADLEGVSVSLQCDYEVVDVSILPREYMAPNHAALRIACRQFKTGEIKGVAGVRFFEKPVVRSRSS